MYLFIYLFKKNKYIFAFFGANLDDILSKKNAIVLINSWEWLWIREYGAPGEKELVIKSHWVICSDLKEIVSASKVIDE